jgi:hypothetical protein
MNTQPTTADLLRRVGVRAGVGLWQHRGGLLLAALVSVALAGYGTMTWSAGGQPTLAQGASSSVTGDCADTVMAAIADKSPTAAQRAYRCMDPAFQQGVTEQAFVQQMAARSLANVQKVARVGDYRAPTGGTMVYYAVDGSVQSAGYIVYLGPDGKVLKVE